MSRPYSSFIKKARLFSVLAVTLLFALCLAASAAADDQEEWSSFSFDTSSESYKRKGERAFDLRSGRYATSEFSRSHDGDFIVMVGFNPDWVTFRTMDWIKVLFSDSGESDSKVDEKAERLPNCVPVHYGDSYIASFEGNTYTIKLVEGDYNFPVGRAHFLYRAGGMPGPEHEPRKPAARSKSRPAAPGDVIKSRSSGTAEVEMDPSKGNFRMRIEENDTIDFFGTSKSPAKQGDAGDRAPGIDQRARYKGFTPGPQKRAAGWVYNLNVIVTAPSAEDAGVEEADLKAKIDGPAKSSSVYNKTRAGRTRIFKFRNIPAGEYNLEVAYGDETITDTVEIEKGPEGDFTEIEVAFE